MSQTQSNSSYKLKIIAGLHKDAELYLKEDIRYTIGSSDACDIVLLDSGVDEHHLSFSITRGKVHLFEKNDDVFVDGRILPETPFFLSPFQVTSLGEAHLVIGPTDAPWPDIDPPHVRDDEPCVTTLDLVVLDQKTQFPDNIPQETRFQMMLRIFLERLSLANRKLLLAVCTFLIALGIFIGDTWLSPTILDTIQEHPLADSNNARLHPSSPLLSLFDGIQAVHKNTMVNAGLVEPSVPTKIYAEGVGDTAADHVRKVLKTNWGQRLLEVPIDSHRVEFKGFDDQDRQDLRMDLKRSDQGELSIKAVTQTTKKKKAILSQLGDIIRVKVDVAQEMENVCTRVLEKKGVRNAKASYDIGKNAFTIQGTSGSKNTIESVYDIVAKAFPDIRVNNDVKMNAHRPARVSIRAVSTGGLPYVILKDGSKIFNGGRLSNGCSLAGIAEDHILLECNGTKRKQKL